MIIVNLQKVQKAILDAQEDELSLRDATDLAKDISNRIEKIPAFVCNKDATLADLMEFIMTEDEENE